MFSEVLVFVVEQILEEQEESLAGLVKDVELRVLHVVFLLQIHHQEECCLETVFLIFFGKKKV